MSRLSKAILGEAEPGQARSFMLGLDEPGLQQELGQKRAPKYRHGLQLRPVTSAAYASQLSAEMGWDLNIPGIWQQYATRGKFYVIYQDGEPFLGVWISDDGRHTEVVPKLKQQNQQQ